MEDTGKLETLGRYRLVRRVGRGGMGEVWLAEDPHLLRQVALKILPVRKRDDEEFLQRFEREARAAAALHHPHILPVHDYGQQQLPDNQAITYLVMSYVSSGSVEDRLKTLSNAQQMLTQDEALAYLFQVAEAIDYAHAHKIVHRDIKPGNMLLRDNNWLLLTDFGIARILTDADAFTSGLYLGTPTYMAPEQAQGQAVPASDIYSLAVVAYQLFTGHLPFQADNPFALSFQHAFAPPSSPRIFNPALSPEFELALLRGLLKDPAQRPPTAIAYVTGLDQALKSFPSYSPPPAQEQDSAALTPTTKVDLRRRRILQATGIGAGVLLVGGGATIYLVNAQARPKALAATPTATQAHPTVDPNGPLIVSAAFTAPANTMVWSPQANVVSVSSRDGQVVVWDLTAAGPSSAPRELGRFTRGISFTNLLTAWSPNGKTLAVANAKYDLNTSSYRTLVYKPDLSSEISGFTLETTEEVKGLSWTSKNYLLTVATVTGDVTKIQLMLWNMNQPKQNALSSTIPIELTFTQTAGNWAVVSPNGSTLAICASGGLLIGHLDISGQGNLWKQTGKQLQPDNSDADIVAWSPNGQYVAALPRSVSDNGIVVVWDASKQYQLVLPSLATSSVPTLITTLAWSPSLSKSVLALGGSNGQIYLWNVGSSPEPYRILSGSIQSAVTTLAWSSDGHWLAAGYDNNSTTILFWRL